MFTATFDYNHSQKLILHVYPPTATVSVNGNLENITDGTFSKDYYFGTYQYVVSADRYHQFEDTITINSLTRPQERTIRLKQAFGWLQVGNADEMPGARIFIDNKPAGKVTASPLALASGRHSVKVAREGFQNFEKDVFIKDSLVEFVTPPLTGNYGTVSISVPDKEAMIIVDGDSVGTGSWKGNLNVGNHSIECRRPFYHSTMKDITVADKSSESYRLEAPTAILTTAVITTDVPTDLYVDGKEYSKEQREHHVSDLSQGKHTFRLVHQGYRTEEITDVLSGDKPYSRSLSMQPVVSVSFKTPQKNISLYVDDRFMGILPVDTVISSGRHSISYVRPGYKTATTTKSFVKDNDEFHQSIHRIFYRRFELYGETGYQAAFAPGWYAAIGGNIGLFNIEANYVMPMKTIKRTPDDYYSIVEGTTSDLNFKSNYGLKMGMAIKLGGRWRIIPQVGVQAMVVERTEHRYADNGYDKTQSVVVKDKSKTRCTFNAGVKLQVAIIPHVSVTFMPQWSTCITWNIDYKDFDEESVASFRDFDIPKKSLFTYFGSKSAYNYMLSSLRLNFGVNIYL